MSDHLCQQIGAVQSMTRHANDHFSRQDVADLEKRRHVDQGVKR